jgi:glycosyltransferase involved in cell wall biosynthesis
LVDSRLAPRKAALVHDFLVDLRGADRVFSAIADIWPDAPIYTAVYDEGGTEGRFAHRDIRTSFLQRLHPTASTFRALLPLYPSAIESFDLSEYDLVISSSSAWAHAVVCHEHTTHVSYCYNPFRYAWNDRDRTLADLPDPVSRAALRGILRRWRQWDWIAAQRVDRYLTISQTARARIRHYWGRDATIVHPPVDIQRFAPAEPQGYYLVLSELMRHKQIDIAVEAFSRLRLPLVIAGDGPDGRRLRRMAGPTVRFTGRVPDAEAARLLAGCQALVVTAVEEFGLAAVEAQASGRPVISIGAGGALETVREGKTGVYWHGGPAELAGAVTSFDADAIDPQACVENARRFSLDRFRARLPGEVEQALRGERDHERALSRRRARSRRGLARPYR